MLSYSILHENRSLTKTQLGKILKKIITSKNGVEIDNVIFHGIYTEV